MYVGTVGHEHRRFGCMSRGKASVRYGLGSPRCGDWLGNLGYLVASADNLLALAILVELDIFVFPLCALPNFDFTTASDNTYSHGREKVVGSVGVHVDSAVKHGRGILANARIDHGFASRVILDEV